MRRKDGTEIDRNNREQGEVGQSPDKRAFDETALLTADEVRGLPSRTERGQLGYAVLYVFAREHGHFPDHDDDLDFLVRKLAVRLGVPHNEFEEYNILGRTAVRHRSDIRSRLGMREFSRSELKVHNQWLIDQLAKGASANDLSLPFREHLKVSGLEPPAVGYLERVIRGGVRLYNEQLHHRLSKLIGDIGHTSINALVATAGGREASEFAMLRRDPGALGVKSILAEVDKLTRLRRMGIPANLFGGVPAHQVRDLRRRAALAKSQELQRLSMRTRNAQVGAYIWTRTREVTDSLADLLIQVIHRINARADKRVTREMVADFKRVHGKHGLLFRVAAAAVETPDGTVCDVIFPVVSKELLKELVKEFRSTGASYRTKVQVRMRSSYAKHYRRILPAVLGVLDFRSNNDVHRPVLDAIALIKSHAGRRSPIYAADEEVPLEVVPEAWRSLVFDDEGRVQRIPYELCVLAALRDRLRTKEIWITGANRFRNPDEDLPKDYAERRTEYYAAIGQPLGADKFVAELQSAMDLRLTVLDAGLDRNVGVRIQSNGRLRVSPYKAKEDAPNLAALKGEVGKRWPMVNLLDLLKEADHLARFTDILRPSGSRIPEDSLRRRLLLVLYGMGTNLGIKRLAAGNHGETYDDLLYVRRHFLGRDRLRAAIGRVTDCLLAARNPGIWGSATSCASDSKKFGAWDQNLMTEWHQRYGGPGVMIYWHVERKATCIFSQLKRCSSSEVASMIEGVLHHCTTMEVDRQYVDTHGQSHVAFAFCHLLGFRLLPRLKNINRQKLSRPRAGEPTDFRISRRRSPGPSIWA